MGRLEGPIRNQGTAAGQKAKIETPAGEDGECSQGFRPCRDGEGRPDEGTPESKDVIIVLLTVAFLLQKLYEVHRFIIAHLQPALE